MNGITQTCSPVTFITAEPEIPSCPDRRVVFQICNSNASRDDNFNIKLNGTQIGAVDLSTDAQVGSVFIADPTNTLTITGSDFDCPIPGMVVYYFDPALLQPSNTINMENTQDNGNGNYGTIGIRNYELITDPNTGLTSLADPCVIADLLYNPSNGQDFEVTFNYDACCPEDVPTAPAAAVNPGQGL